jgi:hypothetical protein
MLRHLGLIAVCACIVASVGCDGGHVTAPTPQPSPLPTVAVEFSGRVVNADTGGPVGNVQASLQNVSFQGTDPAGWSTPKDTATSGGDGTFTLRVNLPTSWSFAYIKVTGAEYDGVGGINAGGPANGTSIRIGWEIRMYPTLVIRPGESIDVRVGSVGSCGWGGDAGFCRRVLVAASPGDPVELELVPDDSSKPMGLSPDDYLGAYAPVRRLVVPPGSFPYVVGDGIARLTARR